MVPHMGTLLKGDIGHAYNNFKIAAGLKEGEAKGMWWHDGDCYKWMESAMYVYAGNHDEPRCTLKMSSSDFLDLMNGKLPAMQAYTSGKLKIEGDIMKSQLVEKLFKFQA